MILEILKYPNTNLRIISEVVKDEEFGKDLIYIITNMFETMYSTRGIGLSGTQVGIHKRIIVIDISKITRNPHDIYTIINPVIIDCSGTQISTEGCLSIPNIFKDIERYDEITVQYNNAIGVSNQIKCSGLLSACMQHEIDHLNGKLIIDCEKYSIQ